MWGDDVEKSFRTRYQAGWFANDPTFPAVPAGVTFTDPVRNYGTEADFYRDPINGRVKNASDEGTFITSFTPHRSPLGLVIDRDSILGSTFQGHAFVLSFMPGGDSTGFTPLSPWGSPCPFVDHSRELVQMNLTYDAGIDNYTMTTSNIAEGFYLPVDAELVSNFLYVIENGGSIWRITFPAQVGISKIYKNSAAFVYPSPFNQSTTIEFNNPEKQNCKLNIVNAYGKNILSIGNITSNKVVVEKKNMASGLYFFQIMSKDKVISSGKLILE